MPNWCYNTIHITGKHKYIIQMLKSVMRGREFDFRRLIPEPKTRKECPEQYILKDQPVEKLKGREWFDWYTWHCDKWGCKWTASDTELIWITKKHIIIYFNTPWSPPNGIMLECYNRFKHLSFHWHIVEEGNNFEPFTTHNINDAVRYY